MNKILIVEPDLLLGNNLKKFLEHYGFNCFLVTNGQSAIESVDNFLPDLVILEIQLVNHSGIEFLYELRSYEDTRLLKVIVYSYISKSSWHDSWKIIEEKLLIKDYLYKPEANFYQVLSTINHF
jgi:DNA-binding response OmpR family regulator